MSKTLNNRGIVIRNHGSRRICRAAYPLCHRVSWGLNTGPVSSKLERQEKLWLNFLQEHNGSLFFFRIYSFDFACHFDYSFIQFCWIFLSRIDFYLHFLVHRKVRPIFERYQSTNPTDVDDPTTEFVFPGAGCDYYPERSLKSKIFSFFTQIQATFFTDGFYFFASAELSKCGTKYVLSTSELWGHSSSA